jgi:hypothetical protein
LGKMSGGMHAPDEHVSPPAPQLLPSQSVSAQSTLPSQSSSRPSPQVVSVAAAGVQVAGVLLLPPVPPPPAPVGLWFWEDASELQAAAGTSKRSQGAPQKSQSRFEVGMTNLPPQAQSPRIFVTTRHEKLSNGVSTRNGYEVISTTA